MEKRKSAILLILLVLLVFGTCASASVVQFVDSAYIGNGTLTISYPNNTLAVVLHSSETYELRNGTGYVFEYQPAGFVQLDQESDTTWTFPTLRFILTYFMDPVHLFTLLLLIFLLIVVVIMI